MESGSYRFGVFVGRFFRNFYSVYRVFRMAQRDDKFSKRLERDLNKLPDALTVYEKLPSLINAYEAHVHHGGDHLTYRVVCQEIRNLTGINTSRKSEPTEPDWGGEPPPEFLMRK